MVDRVFRVGIPIVMATLVVAICFLGWSAMNVEFGSPDHSPGVVTETVLCLGDSITYGYGGQRSYPDFLSSLLGSSWVVVDDGVNGFKSSDVLNHIDVEMVRHHPDVVVLMIGLNDVCSGHTVVEIESNIESCVFVSRSYGAEVVLLTILPSGVGIGGVAQAARYAVNSWIMDYSADGVVSLDSNASMTNSSDVWEMCDGYSFDHTHLTAVGASMLARIVYDGYFARGS